MTCVWNVNTFKHINYYIFTISTSNTDMCITKIYSPAHLSVCINQITHRTEWGRDSYNNMFASETTGVFKIYIFKIGTLTRIIFNTVFKYSFCLWCKHFLQLEHILIL